MPEPKSGGIDQTLLTHCKSNIHYVHLNQNQLYFWRTYHSHLGTPHCAGLAQVARLIIGKPIHATPLVCFPQEADIQLGWELYKRTIRLRPARTSSWFTQLPRAGSAGHPTAIQLMSVHCLLRKYIRKRKT